MGAIRVVVFPLIPLPIKEANLLDFDNSSTIKMFPLIPLPIKEAIFPTFSDVWGHQVSINSTSYKRSDNY